jgi:amidase
MAPKNWKEVAAEKRDAVLALIPQDWRIPAIPSAQEQRDVTGKFIEQYLSREEIDITGTDAPNIVKNTSDGTWSAHQVARAFCHRAAIAHQMVKCPSG